MAASNPSPTQEVERLWEISVCDECDELLQPGEVHRHREGVRGIGIDVAVVPAAALQAEVEKREEVEDQLATAELRIEGLDVMRANLNCQREEAESRISSAVEKLEECVEGQRAAKDDRAHLVRERAGLLLPIYEELLQLLRDKGTEQGGESKDAAADGLDTGPRDRACDRGVCGRDRRHVPADRSSLAGVSIEGDPGLGELLGWVDGLRLRKLLASEDESARREFRAADRGAANTLEDVAARIRKLLPANSTQQSTTGKEDCER